MSVSTRTDILTYFAKQGDIEEKTDVNGDKYYFVKSSKPRTVDIFEHEKRNKIVTKEAFQRLMRGGVFAYKQTWVFGGPTGHIYTKKNLCSDRPPYFWFLLPGKEKKELSITKEAYDLFMEAQKFSKEHGDTYLNDTELIIEMSMNRMGLPYPKIDVPYYAGAIIDE